MTRHSQNSARAYLYPLLRIAKLDAMHQTLRHKIQDPWRQFEDQALLPEYLRFELMEGLQ